MCSILTFDVQDLYLCAVLYLPFFQQVSQRQQDKATEVLQVRQAKGEVDSKQGRVS